MVYDPDKDKDKDKDGDVSITSGDSDFNEPDDVDETFENDDWFDADKYKQAAQIAYDFSIGKMRETGDQQRKSAAQQQQFREKDEERDYKQSQKSYRF